MKYQGQDFVLIELYGEGHYSSSKESHIGFMLMNDYLKYEEKIKQYTPWFRGLDGKHSDVEGEIIVSKTKLGICNAYLGHTSTWKFYESFLESIAGDDDLGRLVEVSKVIANRFTVSKVIAVDYDGESFYFSQSSCEPFQEGK